MEWQTVLSHESFRTALRKFAMYSNFELHWVKRSMTELSARCGDHQFPWRIHGSILQSGPKFIVRTYSEKHTCSKPMMGLVHSQATSALITDWIKEWLRLHPSYAPKEILIDFLSCPRTEALVIKSLIRGRGATSLKISTCTR